MITVQKIFLSASDTDDPLALGSMMCAFSKKHLCDVEATYKGVRLTKSFGDGLVPHSIAANYYSTVAREQHKRV